MERKLKRQQRTVGSIVKIPLENGYHTYGRILDYGLAFYDSRTKEELKPEEIINKKILFRTGVYNDVITRGYWLKVGKPIPPEAKLLETPVWYTEDIITAKVMIHREGKQIPATREEVRDIESATVWDYASMEKRLNDYFAGRKNQKVENMKQGRPLSGYTTKSN